MEPNFEIVEKESIFSLKFPTAEVLQDTYAIHQRTIDLLRAMYLGNIEHSKIKIFFEDNISTKMVETTIWAVTDRSVILKRGVGIPINRILKSC